MGKLYDRLQDQLKGDYSRDAEEYLKVYERLKEISGGHVWESHWNTLVNVRFFGVQPTAKRIYSLSPIGRIFFNGMN